MYPLQAFVSEGRSPLTIAAAEGDIDQIEELCDKGCKASEPDALQDTPLHLACMFGHLEIVQLLVTEFDADVHAVNNEGWTPLCCAVASGQLDIVKFLQKHGADLSWKTPWGMGLLHIAAWYGQPDTAAWLLQQATAVNEETDHGCRAFDMTRPGTIRKMLYAAMTYAK